MTPCPPDIAPPRVAAVLQAVDRAVQAIPPAFPLEATVAVNPFLGQSGLDFATAAERLARVAGIRLAPARAAFRAAVAQGRITEEDLAAALAASACPGRPRSVAELKAALSEEAPDSVALPTIADLAAEESGTDWPAVIARSVGLWAAGHFDRGQALWTPRPGQGAYAAWREWATHDLTPEIAGLEGFCAHVGAAPDSAERAILRAAERLGVVPEAAEGVFHRLLLSLGGWAQHARWVLWQAEAAGGTAATPAELLAIRLVWEEALFERLPAVGAAWRRTVARHAEPVAPSRERVIEAILQDAADRAHQRRLAAALSGPRPAAGPPVLQAVFCIDVRSEVFRRALEAQSPAIATSGFAGFFGLPVAHRPAGRTEAAAHLPVLLRPALRSCEAVAPAEEEARRIGARARRAWGRFRQAAVSSFAFVEAAGPAYGWKLLRDALRLPAGGPRRDAAPRFDPPLDDAQKAATAATVLRAMGLTEGFAPLVLLLGHGGNMRNNAHESAYHCGACGGRTGEVSTRLLAALLNDPGTRAGLGGAGIVIPDDVLFVAGQHDTTTDRVTLFADGPSGAHAAGLAQARAWLDAAGAMARAERALRLPGASAGAIPARARDWAEVRPEWGLAGCAAFIAAPRSATAGRDLGGRAFLHDYDWRRDRDFGTLELILTAPVVVASWISLQYYGSAVAPAAFGGGNKLIHNVVGGIGVVEGNGGLMRAGLPWQAVHDGQRLAHEPLRLSVMIEAPRAAIAAVLARHAGLRALFDHGWLHLFALEEGRLAHRYCPGLRWEGQQAVAQAA